MARGAICPLSGRAVLCSLDMPLECVPLRLRRDVASTLSAGTWAVVPQYLHTCACCILRNENDRGSKIYWKSRRTKTMHADNREMRVCIWGHLSDMSKDPLQRAWGFCLTWVTRQEAICSQGRREADGVKPTSCPLSHFSAL